MKYPDLIDAGLWVIELRCRIVKVSKIVIRDAPIVDGLAEGRRAVLDAARIVERGRRVGVLVVDERAGRADEEVVVRGHREGVHMGVPGMVADLQDGDILAALRAQPIPGLQTARRQPLGLGDARPAAHVGQVVRGGALMRYALPAIATGA